MLCPDSPNGFSKTVIFDIIPQPDTDIDKIPISPSDFLSFYLYSYVCVCVCVCVCVFESLRYTLETNTTL